MEAGAAWNHCSWQHHLRPLDERLGFAVSDVANDDNGLDRRMVTFLRGFHLPRSDR